jgi:cell division protein FtsQ
MPPGLMSEHHYSFPVLTGIDAGDPLPSRRARVDLYSRLMSELDSNGQHLSDQISEIDLTDPEDARVSMPEQGTDVLAHFGQDHFLERYQRYKAHIGEWRQQYPKLSAVDLRYEQQVVLEMNKGQAGAQASLNAAAATPVATKPLDPPMPTPKPQAIAKPEAGKRASVVPAGVPAKKPAAHPVTTSHAATKTPAKASLKTAAAKKTKDKKHVQTKPAAQKKSKPKTAVKETHGPVTQTQ